MKLLTPATLICTLLACQLAACAAMKAVPEFSIGRDLSVERMRESWNVYPKSLLPHPKGGVFLTRNRGYETSALGFDRIIDMIEEFEMELNFGFGDRNPKPSAEREGTDLKAHADTVAVLFSSRPVEVEPSTPTKDSHSVEGGALFLLAGDQNAFLTFKRFSQPTNINQRYLDIVYEQSFKHTASKKHFSCEIKDPNLRQIRVKVYAHANSGQLRVTYKIGDDRSAEYKQCFTMAHYDRYIGHHFFYAGVQALTPEERNTEIFLSDARLLLTKLVIDFGHEGTYDQKVFDRLQARMESLDKVKTLPAPVLTGLLGLQDFTAKKAVQLNKYVVDFHKGIQSLQEHFLNSISKSKKKSYSDIKILQTIIEKLAEVEQRQESIYKKFARLHKLISKEANIQTIESELKAVQELVVQVANNIENRGLGDIISKSQELTKIFEDISSHENGLKNLIDMHNWNVSFSESAGWSHYLLAVGALTVLVFICRTMCMIQKSRKSHFL